MEKEKFYTELNDMDDAFEALEPELAVTLSDKEQGVEGYIVVWNTKISEGGPLHKMGKGGTRVTPGVSLDEIKMLAKIMALKNAAAGLPLGGAKSGLKIDSRAPDAEQKYKRFVELSKPYLHENGGLFGGFGYDIGARPEMAVWACETLGSGRSFTGKTVAMGGTDYDVEGIAGLGVAVAAKTALEHDEKTAKGARFAVQGVGAMGAAVIRYFSEFGGILGAVSDPRLGGTWFFDQGAPDSFIDAIAKGDIEYAKKHLNTSEHHSTKPDSQDVLYADVDVLFPCAIHNVITDDNANLIRAGYISEGANNPISDEARTILFEKDIVVIPDFIANPGGVIAAFVELTSDITAEESAKTRGKVKIAKDTTISRITDNVNNVLDLAKEMNVRPSDAGRYLALKKILTPS